MPRPAADDRRNARPPFLAERAAATLEKYLHIEALSGTVLLLAALVALCWVNSPFASSYESLWHAPLGLQIGPWSFTQTLHFWINDGLMTLFFLVVGMEIRREIHEGALSTLQQAALPLAAAVGGVVAPALLYLAVNPDPPARSGWAIPTATDIAFAVGVLALLGKRIPGNIRVILLALAVIDDLIAVLVIALFYSGGLSIEGLAVSAAGMVAVLGFQRAGVTSAWAYVLPGALVWVGLLITGAHPTLAGVALGLLTPVRSWNESPPPAVRVQKALHPWVAYGIMPLFALANAGVVIDAGALASGHALFVATGAALALAVGKPLGVVGAAWCAVRAGWCQLPPGVTWRGIILLGLLTGIGFTMSIFIAMLAFDDDGLVTAAKLGVLVGSFAAALVGLGWGAFCLRSRR